MAAETFAQLLVTRLRADAQLLRALTKHSTLVGGARERAIAELLRGLIPRRYEILEGAIASSPGDVSRHQVDVMIVDTLDYPMLLRAGNVAVVMKQAVRGIVEVKSVVVSRTKNERETDVFTRMLIQVGRLRAALPQDAHVPTALFLFDDSADLTRVREWLTDAIESRADRKPEDRAALTSVTLPTYIVTMAGVIIEKDQARPTYKLYGQTDSVSATIYLAARLLRAVALPPDEAESSGRPGPAGSHAHLADVYTDFAGYLEGDQLRPDDTLDISDPQPLP